MYNKDYPYISNFNAITNDTSDEFQIIRTCFNIAGNFIIGFDKHDKIFFANKKALEILETEEEKILGTNVYDFIADKKNKEKLNELKENIYKKDFNSRSKNRVIDIHSKSGNCFIIEMNLFPLSSQNDKFKGYILSGEDISKFIKSEKLLKETLKNYRLLASNIPDMDMFLFDQELRYLIAEGSEMKKTGLNSDYYEGKTFYETHDETIQQTLLPIYEGALAGKEISVEYKYNNSDFIISAYPILNNDDEIVGGMAIAQNITKEKRNAVQLRKEKDRAEQANKAKSEFLANISHEIRTPLNAINGFTEQLSQTQLNEKQLKFVNIIDKSSDHLLSLVNDVLVISKIEAGELEFAKNGFDIVKLIEDVYSTLWIKAEQKKINFSYHIDDRLNYIVLGDAFRLKQVLINILNNAIKFTQEGFVRISLELIHKNDEKLIVQLKISDSGIGIKKDKLNTIFEQFKQADSTITKKFGGTGLGLTISKRIINSLDGTIDVESEEGIGTTFTLEMPFEIGDKEDIPNEQELNFQKDSFNNTKVLLVDDDSVNRLLGITILEKFDIEVQVANNGKEAIEMIKAEDFNVILLDIHMPEVSGIDVAKFVREEKNDYHTKIIAVTASFLKDGVNKYYNVGINDYIIKPYSELTLYNKLSKALGKKQEPQDELQEDIILDNDKEKGLKLYNLEDLNKMASNDRNFVKKMLNTFISNARNGLDKMSHAYTTENWEIVGETAHKLLPSFRHLKVYKVEQDLLLLKEKTLIEKDVSQIPDIFDRVSENIEKVTLQLEKEIL